MGKKDKDSRRPNIFRLIFFLAVSGGLIWWLSGQVEIGSKEMEGEVKGEEVVDQLDTSFPLKEQRINEISKEIEKKLPQIVKERIEKINNQVPIKSEEVVKITEKVLEETKLSEEIEKIIIKTTQEVESFPEKQKKDLKKEAIKQVCESLLNEVEDDKTEE